MVNTYTGKSPRNARIKIDYTGECPSVKFQYPRKDGYVGSMFIEVFLCWVLILWLFCVIFSLGVTSTYLTFQNDTLNESNLNSSQIEEDLGCKYVSYTSLIKTKETLKEKIIYFLKGIKTLFDIFFLILLPPILINKIFKKKLNALFPMWQASKSEKKYIKFKPKDIKTTTINGKKEIYVEIPYFQNVILKYNAKKDFSKYLDIMEIKEQNFQTEEKPTRKDRKRRRKSKGNCKRKKERYVKKRNEWHWYAKFYFNKIPKIGSLDVIFK